MDLAARQHASHKAFYERFATRVERFHGSIAAAVTPEVPERSLPNSVLYDDPADVLPALPDLERLYAGAGVRAWTVWVLPGHGELAEALSAAGHEHDGRPMQMGAPLEEVDLSAPAPPGLEPVTDWRAVGEVNDAAYGISGLAAAFAGFRPEGAHGWLVMEDGRAVATAAVLEHDGDANVTFVATRPEARGRGLCRGLLAHALREAAARGCTTTTLEGSPMGEPLYARLGYRSLGRFGLWERRVRDESA